LPVVSRIQESGKLDKSGLLAAFYHTGIDLVTVGRGSQNLRHKSRLESKSVSKWNKNFDFGVL